MDDRPNRILPVLAPLLLATGVSLFTMAPSIYPGDSPEFATAAHTLGIPHPPGYPHYVLLGKLFALLPFGNVAFRLNLLSALGTGLAAGAFSWIVLRLTGHPFPAASGALLMAFSRDIWAQSGSAEVYTLNLFGALLLLCLAAESALRPSGGEGTPPGPGPREGALFRSAAFLFGYSLGIHYFILFAAPGILYLFRRGMGSRAFLRASGGAVPAFLAGWILFLFLPLRAMAHPPLNWGETSDPVNFLLHIGWGQYSGRPSLGFSWERFFLRARDLIGLFGSQWPLPLHLFLPAGLLFLWNRRRSDFLPTAVLLLLVPSLATLLLLNDPGSEIFFGLSSNKFLVPYAMYGLILVLGTCQAGEWLGSLSRPNLPAFLRGPAAAAAGVLLCLSVGWTLWSNWSVADRSRSTLLGAYTLNLLDPLPPGSGLAVEYDVPTFPLLYSRYVEQYRPDVALYGRTGILFGTDYNEAYGAKGAAAQERSRRHIDGELILRHRGRMYFANQTAPYAPGGDSPALPFGLAYFPAGGGLPPKLPDIWSSSFVTSPFREVPDSLDHRNRELVSDMYRMSAEAEIRKNHLDNASRLLEKAVTVAPGYYWIHYYGGILRYQAFRDVAEAENLLKKAGRIIPSEEVPGVIGILRFESGDIPAAIRHFRNSLSINPEHIPSLINLAECYLASGNSAMAEQVLRKASVADPGQVRVWMRLGQIQGADARFPEAIDSFSRAIRIDPSNPEAHFQRAVAEMEIGRREEALRDLRRAMQLDPANRQYRNFLLQRVPGQS